MSAAAALAFALANPDARIAEHNIERFEESGKIDRVYLAHLSADARLEVARAGIRIRRRHGGLIGWTLAGG